MTENIFITGATGCIGNYLVEQLISNENYHLFLLVRKGKDGLRKNIKEAKNITVLQGQFRNIQDFKEYIYNSDYVINIATSWGGHVANLDNVKNLLSLVSPLKLKKFIQFQTASILNREHQVLEEANTLGTGYVQGKYNIYHFTKNHPLSEKIIRVYPTVVIGGGKEIPYSHVSQGLLEFKKKINIISRFYIDLGFHFMHSEDIAKCVIHIMKNIENEQDIVLGNDFITLKDFLAQACSFYGKKPFFRVKIPNWFLKLFILLFPKRVSNWDKFCFRYKWFKYNTVNCKTYNIETNKFNVNGIFAELEENRQ
jgi:nucleoside-diphosphate-sugar epimerase